MDRFGPEIEYDLHHELGLDLEDWFAGHHEWAKLLRMVDQLPRHSHYVAALHEDPETAEQLAKIETSGGMTLRGWTYERELLTALVDAVGRETSTLVAVNSKSGKGPRVTPLPRPRTAVDRYRHAADVEYAQGIVALFLPNGRTEA